MIRNAETFEHGDELLNGREFQHQSHAMIVGRRDAFVLEELGAGNVTLVVVFFLADLKEHERRIVEVIGDPVDGDEHGFTREDRKSTRLNSSHPSISYA